MSPHRILIIRLSSLGDILHTVPAFHSLRRTFPSAHIDWLVEKRMEFLLSTIPGIDGTVAVDTKALRSYPWRLQDWKQLYGSVDKLRSRHYDVSLDFQGLLKTAVLGLLSGAKVRIGFSTNLVRERPAAWFYHRTVDNGAAARHITELNQLLASEAGAERGTWRPELRANSSDTNYVEQLLEREQLSDFVIINPGGGWTTKTWRPERYGFLAEKIQSSLGLPVVVTTGPNEEALYDSIRQNCRGTPPRHFRLNFLQLIPLIRRSLLLIACDTGPLHLACALGRPVVGIFGPTSPIRNGPWSSLDEVVVRRLPCSFCYQRACPTHNECMDISVDEVLGAVVRRLNNLR